MTKLTEERLDDAITQKFVRMLMRYDPDSGLLFWNARTPDLFESCHKWTAEQKCRSWNTRHEGNEAFKYVNSEGYKTGMILRVSLKAHRVIWLFQTGEWPKHEIDHINGCRTDNRFCNLRSVTATENSRNRSVTKLNTSGIVGVHFEKRDKKWVVQIHDLTGERRRWNFEHKPDAVRRRQAAGILFSYHKNHGRARHATA